MYGTPNFVRVKKYGVPEDDGVKFYPTSWTYTNSIQPVMIGQGWYRPHPNTTYDLGLDWIWEGPGGGGGMFYTCKQSWILYGFLVWKDMTFTGEKWGHAVVDADETSGTNTRSSQNENLICYEYFEWWIDAAGRYQEDVLYTWCEEEYET